MRTSTAMGNATLANRTAKTDSAGKYSFTLNVTGSVTIREAVKPGWRQTFPGEPTLAQVLTITGGGTIKDVNFGNSDNDGFDHGDAPSPYPTLEANNGPTHAIVSGFGLGVEATDGSTVAVDGEPDGLPDANALGDDNDNFDDENGVVFTTGLSPGKASTVTVTVSLGTNGPGMLQGWIDFNRDGDWADTGEQVFKNQTLAAGVHSLTVNVPSTAIPGTTFARFRYGYEKICPTSAPRTPARWRTIGWTSCPTSPTRWTTSTPSSRTAGTTPSTCWPTTFPARTGLRSCGFAT